jgi:hypothetical protein
MTKENQDISILFISNTYCQIGVSRETSDGCYIVKMLFLNNKKQLEDDLTDNKQLPVSHALIIHNRSFFQN